MNCLKCAQPVNVDITHVSSWLGFTSYPMVCCHCDTINWIEIKEAHETVNLNPKPLSEKIPPLEESTWVFVRNREHVKFLEPGTIIRRSHVHYRVKFNDGTIIWMPEHWIVAIPKHLLGM